MLATQCRVRGQDLFVQSLQRWGGISAEVVGQLLADTLVVGQRLGLAPVAVQREHVLAGKTFVKGVRPDVIGQFGEHLGMPATVEQLVDEVKAGEIVLFKQRAAQDGEPRRVDAGKRLTSPKLEGRREPSMLDQLPKPVHINTFRGRGDPVPSRLPDNVNTGQPRQRLPQHSHTALQGTARTSRQPLITPNPIHQLIDRHGPVSIDE